MKQTKTAIASNMASYQPNHVKEVAIYCWQDLEKQFLDYLYVEKSYSVNTLSAYKRDLRKYQDYLQAQNISDLSKVNQQILEDFTQTLANGEDNKLPLKPSSIARTLAAVRSWHKYLFDQKKISRDISHEISAPKQPKHLPKALSIQEVDQLLKTKSGQQDPISLRDSALLELLYATGARISEVVSLCIDDIDLESEFPLLKLFGKGRKERLVPLGQYAKRAIEKYLVSARPTLALRGKAGGKLFLNKRGNPLSRQSAWEIIKNASEQAHISAEVSPHTLRHSFATHLLNGGADIRVVQELLGHASVTTTQIYTKITLEMLEEVYLASHPRARH